MKKLIITVIALGLMCNGCTWLGWGDDSDEAASAQAAEPATEAVEPEPAPAASLPEAKVKVSKPAPVKKGTKSEAQIKKELDQMGHKLAAQSARTLLPNKAHKEVKKVGNEWVATYVEVDANHVTTELRPSNAGQYVGFIRYQERIYECRGATREAALNAPCSQTRSRNLNELIRYDGRAWQD